MQFHCDISLFGVHALGVCVSAPVCLCTIFNYTRNWRARENHCQKRIEVEVMLFFDENNLFIFIQNVCAGLLYILSLLVFRMY